MLSIIISCTKEDKTILKLIESIKDACHGFYEILIIGIDNKDAIKSTIKDKNIIFIESMKKGSALRYEAALKAKGSYLWFIESTTLVLDIPSILIQEKAPIVIFDYYKNYEIVKGTCDYIKDNTLSNKWIDRKVYLKECVCLKDKSISFFESNLILAFLHRKNYKANVKDGSPLCNITQEDKDYFTRANDFILWALNYIDIIILLSCNFTKEERLFYFGENAIENIQKTVIKKAIYTILHATDFSQMLKQIFTYLISIKDIKIISEELECFNQIDSKNKNLILQELNNLFLPKPQNQTHPLNIKVLDDTSPLYDILHYVGHHKMQYKYRRYKLNDYLVSFTNTITAYKGEDSPKYFNNRYKAILISYPKGVQNIIKYATLNRVPIFYDRTDNWAALDREYEECENLIIQNAKVVFCSARFLQEDTKKRGAKDVIFIPNGTDIREFSFLEKYERKTAIYIGKSTNKIDTALIKKLARKNPTWDFALYGCENLSIEGSNIKKYSSVNEDVLFDILRKCHVGLIPFIKSDWTCGMLPLKLFNYANAHIPTAYSNCPECDYYSEHFAQVFNLNSIDDFTGKNWTLERILECNEIEDYDEMLKDADWEPKFKLIAKTMGVLE